MAYKLKTHSGAKKRFKKTATGKVKRQLTGTTLVSDADTPKIKRMIPY